MNVYLADMPSKIVVYLAGKMAGLTRVEMCGWRKWAKKFLEHPWIEILDPTVLPADASARKIVESNKGMICKSDVVLAEFNHLDPSLGTVGEIVYAQTIRKPVVAWGAAREIMKNPWVKEHITKRVETLEEAVKYILSGVAR